MSHAAVKHVAFVFLDRRAILDRRFPFHVQLLAELTGAHETVRLDAWLRETGAQLGHAQVEGDALLGFELYAHDGLAFRNRDESDASPEVWKRPEAVERVLEACEVALREALTST